MGGGGVLRWGVTRLGVAPDAGAHARSGLRDTAALTASQRLCSRLDSRAVGELENLPGELSVSLIARIGEPEVLPHVGEELAHLHSAVGGLVLDGLEYVRCDHAENVRGCGFIMAQTPARCEVGLLDNHRYIARNHDTEPRGERV